ncbi:MAG: FAD-dependent monooxygenase [Ferruginibacter sp.]|nr:FAD-dependent monooxygenase [Ferruginibacter sp.]
MQKTVNIAGAGLVGSLLAIFLVKKGYQVNVYERRSDMRKGNVSAGRSINLALSDRGIRALEEVGIMNEIKKISIPMHGRSMHNLDGSSAFQPYGKEGQFINSVSRGQLNMKLMDYAEHQGAKFYFSKKLETIDWKTNCWYFDDGTTTSADLSFGADGAYSAARLQHQIHHDRFQYHQYYIDFGYKELIIPPAANGEFQLEKNALHIWPRGNYMLIALPNMDGSFTCTLFFPFEGNPSFSTLKTPEAFRSFFNETFKDASALMPTLEHDFLHNPVSSMVTVKCYPWIRNGNFALIGDAAHAIVPFFGQGMNCGFEDCSVISELMDNYGSDWSTILNTYQQQRKPDGDAIADLAIGNFVEMRDKVAHKTFLLQKRIEAAFSKKYPDKWIPAYSMVTFSPHIRYSKALALGNRQDTIMKEIMETPNIEQIWDSIEIENKILHLLKLSSDV